ncbi:homocysteine S-methyltransferase family protein [uncultured Corynebacterium sp.]|uniref:homocysteine S-methyltransferase family protein n=1 Tax=uncultured Corynebacterium sp. TaxID=159447 RepID=UPI0026059FE6|nr:homocysteine S-methyltransferase family protein [uncultured Corynebacterium sp.]
MTHEIASSPLSGAPLIFDGGLGTRLADRGNDVTGALWSAEILRNDPDEVQRAHEDFYRAGADVATTCSYQVTFDALGNEAEELLRHSVDLARKAAEVVSAEQGNDRPLYVAASVGPY